MKISIIPKRILVLNACAIFLQLVRAEPNSIVQRIYQSPGSPSSITHAYYDGMGRPLQTVVEDGANDILSGVELDNWGRPTISYKPIPTNSAGHGYYYGSLLSPANSYYDGSVGNGPNAGGYPYSETQYQSNPLRIPVAVGAPGAVFALTGGHAVKDWHFGRSGVSFVNAPSDAILDGLADEAGSIYFLDVHKDANGNYSQAIKDIFGNTLRTWEDAGTASSGVSEAVNYPDGVGRILKTLPAGEVNTGEMAYTYNQFTAAGELVSTDSPDEGTVQFVHDNGGRLRFTRSESDLSGPFNGNRFLSNKYDRFGRLVETGVVTWSGSTNYFADSYANDASFPSQNPPGSPYTYSPKIRNIYDSNSDLNAQFGTSVVFVTSLTNLRGRLVATVAFDESGETQSQAHRVEEYFSYDNEGRIYKRFKMIPGLQVQKFEFTYDLAGKLLSKYYASLNLDFSSSYSDTWTYQYDGRGRLIGIQSDFGKIATYEYNPLGQLTAKHLQKDANAIVDESYTYHIRDWLVGLRASHANSTIYKEDLTYESAGASLSPQYNGNIGSAAHTYSLEASFPIQFYKYDKTNRLVSTIGTAGYTEALAYDAKGRITQKNEGTKAYGPYVYSGGTHQTVNIPNSPMNSVLGNYVYDPDGKMILDRSKKMIVTYDWRGLPSSFKFFKTLPNRPFAWNEVYSLPSSDGIVESAEVQMMYDAAGNRVWKKNFQF